MRKLIYNLEFFGDTDRLTIGKYNFARDLNYEANYARLSHYIGFNNIKPNTGTHAVTAHIELPSINYRSRLAWDGKASELHDILLILSLLTGRNIIALDREPSHGEVILEDPRAYPFGNIMRASVIQENSDERDLATQFAYTANVVYRKIKNKLWLQEYREGYCLFLAKNAFSTFNLALAFVQCWTLWEHLFAIHTDSWLSDDRKVKSLDKIAYILTRYNWIHIVGSIHHRLQIWCDLRNHLTHTGKFPKENRTAWRHALLFIRVTDAILTQIIGLNPSRILDTHGNFESFLKGKSYSVSINDIIRKKRSRTTQKQKNQ